MIIVSTEWIPNLLEVVNEFSNRSHTPIIVFFPKDHLLYQYCQYRNFSISIGTKGRNLCQESESDGPNATVCTSVGYYVLCIFSECWFYVSVTIVEFLL